MSNDRLGAVGGLSDLIDVDMIDESNDLPYNI